MHSSYFSYNIAKPYPFVWFTPSVFIGGTIATVLFSLLNFISSGYYLNVQYSSNPNATVSEAIWFNHWPSFLTSKVQPMCEALDVQINSNFFTNQTGLTYTLTNAWQSTKEDSVDVLSSMTYYNNPIEDCVINYIEIDLESLDRTASQFAWAEWGAVLSGYVTCGITSETGHVKLNLTVNYDYVPDTVSFASGLSSLISADKEARASLWWGESLLSMYWAYLSRTMQNIRSNATDDGLLGISKGTLFFTPSTAIPRIYASAKPPESKPTFDITNLDYFDVDYRFIVDEGGGAYQVLFPGDHDYSTTLSNLYYYDEYPNIWIQADSAAKSFYSTILTDLGQTASTLPNILTNATTLQYFTSNFSLILDPNLNNIANAHPGPALADYDTLKSQTGPLGTTPATISAKYLCQVPRRKAAGELFVAILVADLVFLQAVWQLFKFVTETWFLSPKKRGPKVNYCEGCLLQQRVDGHDDMPFDRITSARNSRQSLIRKTSRSNYDILKDAPAAYTSTYTHTP
jgi:hypothetical protein